MIAVNPIASAAGLVLGLSFGGTVDSLESRLGIL
jgi:hypothetical protein